MDLGPTIVDALGLPDFHGFSGYSLLDQQALAEGAGRQSLFAITQRKICVIKGHDKYIHDYDQDGGRDELYDLAADPGETNNLAADHQDRVAHLRQLVFDWVIQERELKRCYSTEMVSTNLDAETIRQLKAIGYLQP